MRQYAQPAKQLVEGEEVGEGVVAVEVAAAVGAAAEVGLRTLVLKSFRVNLQF